MNRADVWDDSVWAPMPTTCVVHEPDPSPQPTGLLDQFGRPLVRMTDRLPIGFDLSTKERRA